MTAPVKLSPADLHAEDLARDIASDMPSPYCPGRSIASCPSQAARELEDDILVLAKQGKDKKQIEMTLVTRFGESKMGSEHQADILLAIVLGTIVALVTILLAARRWYRPSPGQAGSGSALSGVSMGELDRLEDELDKLDEL